VALPDTHRPPNASRLKGVPQKGAKIAGKYRVEGVIGIDGMGAVLAATHLQLRQRVAIKVMLADSAHNKTAVTRFLREAQAASAIQSEHVVRIFDVGRLKSGVPYLVMELLEGQSLAQMLEQQGALPLHAAVGYVLQACKAVAHAHCAGIVHRDLKPSNLFLATRSDSPPILKVLDFGISKADWMLTDPFTPSLTATTDLVGTPTYMSPEQVRNARVVDWRTDIWSIGTVLYELLAGVAPFVADNLPALAVMIANEQQPRLRARERSDPSGPD
jgi:eukaryotic-like serine/threonine-protein kinase